MKKQNVKKKKLIKSIIRERDIMKKVRSKFLTPLYCVFRDEEYYYLVMELTEEGDLYSFIRPNSNRQPLFRETGEDGIRFVLGCIILGL